MKNQALLLASYMILMSSRAVPPSQLRQKPKRSQKLMTFYPHLSVKSAWRINSNIPSYHNPPTARAMVLRPSSQKSQHATALPTTHPLMYKAHPSPPPLSNMRCLSVTLKSLQVLMAKLPSPSAHSMLTTRSKIQVGSLG